MIKQRTESIEIYKKNNRQDLLQIEENEVKIMSEYLPKQLSEDDTKKLCEEVINKNNLKDYAPEGPHLSINGYKKISELISNRIKSIK